MDDDNFRRQLSSPINDVSSASPLMHPDSAVKEKRAEWEGGSALTQDDRS
jgi:hypothetical protein